jgi:hypothetical protein
MEEDEVKRQGERDCRPEMPDRVDFQYWKTEHPNQQDSWQELKRLIHGRCGRNNHVSHGKRITVVQSRSQLKIVLIILVGDVCEMAAAMPPK